MRQREREGAATILVGVLVAAHLNAHGRPPLRNKVEEFFETADLILEVGAERYHVERDGAADVSKCSACGEDHAQERVFRDRVGRHFLCPRTDERVAVEEG